MRCFLSRLNRDTLERVGGAEAIGAEQPVEADASVLARDKGDGLEFPGKGRRGTRWHRGDVKKVRVWLQRCYCSPLRYRNSHWQFLQIQDRFFYGSNGTGWGKQNGKSLKKITSKGNYSEKSCIFAFENKT